MLFVVSIPDRYAKNLYVALFVMWVLQVFQFLIGTLKTF